ncbi:MAG: MinD/ParA family protein [Thermodesulfobacteriota bacterium]
MKPTMLLNDQDEMDELSPELAAPPPPPLRIIAVTSGKGGVGKSNVVVNLGVALAQQGLKVLLIDADLGLANLDILLGLTPQYTIHDVLQLRKTLPEVLVEGPEGLKILPASSGIPDLAELDEYQKMFLLNELDNYSETIDVALIDTGAGISRNVLFFNIAALERVVVANNEPTSITDAYALIKVLATQHNERRFKLLVNGLSQPREAEAVYRTLLKVSERFLGRDISLEYLGYIPHDEAVSKAVLKQQPVLTLYPKSRVSKSFTQMARRLWEMPGPDEMDGNIKFFWRRLLQYQI